MGRKRKTTVKKTATNRNKKADESENVENTVEDPGEDSIQESIGNISGEASTSVDSSKIPTKPPTPARRTRRSMKVAESELEYRQISPDESSQSLETKIDSTSTILNDPVSLDSKSSSTEDNSNSRYDPVLESIKLEQSDDLYSVKITAEDAVTTSEVKMEIKPETMEIDKTEPENLENVEKKLANIELKDQIKCEEMTTTPDENDSKEKIKIEKKLVIEPSSEEIPQDDESQDSTRIRRSRRIKTILENTRPQYPDMSHLANIPKPSITQQLQAASQESSPATSIVGTPLPSPTPSGDLKVKTRWRKSAELEQETVSQTTTHLMPIEESVYLENQQLDPPAIDERLSKFITIPENIYLSERVVCKINKTMKCECTISEEEIRAGEMGCRTNCINRLLYIECSPKCRLGIYCDNQQFQKRQYSMCDVFKTEKKGYGIIAKQEIFPDQFIIEYVGEVLNTKQFEKRAKIYSQEKNKHYYFMALRSNAIIDATTKGNISRFINHSCDPNAMTQKWTVNGELRVGFFSTRYIKPGEEITFDYQFQRYGKQAQKCFCEAENCRGWIGEQPISDEEEEEDEEGDDEQEEEEDEEEEEEGDGKEPGETEKPADKEKTKPKARRKKRVVKSKATVDEAQDQTSEDDDDYNEKDNEVSQDDIRKPIKKRESTRKYAKKLKKREEMFEDLEIEGEIQELLRTGLKNRAHTVTFSRLVVRAKNLEARTQLLDILQTGDLACKRLFLDYNGLKLFYNYWMSDINKNSVHELQFCIKLLEVLDILPIKNKTVLRDSKVLMMVEKWQNIDLEEKKKKTKEEKKQQKLEEKLKKKRKNLEALNSTNESLTGAGESFEGSGLQNLSMGSIPEPMEDAKLELQDLVKTDVPDEVTCLKMTLKEMANQLLKKWEVLVEDFKIPKKQKLEEMKQHEKEADLHYQTTEKDLDKKDDRFKSRKDPKLLENSKTFYKKPIVAGNDPISKQQRRQLFEIEMAQRDAEKRNLEMYQMHEANCFIFGIKPNMISPMDTPVYVNSITGEYFSLDNRPLPTPPNHENFNIKPPQLPSNPESYDMPKIDLPEHWKYAIDSRGRIYYYHVKIRESQWEPPIKLAPLFKNEDDLEASDESTTDTVDSEEEELLELLKLLQKKRANKDLAKSAENMGTSGGVLEQHHDDDDLEQKIMNNMLMNPAEQSAQSLLTLNLSSSVEASPVAPKKKKKSRRGLVQSKFIKPRTEEDKMYGIQEMKRYKEIKEKLRREKKRRLSKGLPLTDDDDEEDEVTNESNLTDSSIDIDDSIINNKFVTSSIDELEMWNKREKTKTTKKLETIVKPQEKRRSSEFVIPSKKKNKDPAAQTSSGADARELKQQFRDEIRSDIEKYLLPYRDESCKLGRILNDDHYYHLINKLTYSVLVKESKHCENTNNNLKATDSVKSKTREYIKKYMSKFGAIYEKHDEQDYANILNKI